MKILAIETSCDETAAAIVADGREIISNIVRTQIAEHRLYGGVVPEIASRRHTEAITAVTREALDAAGGDVEKTRWIAVIISGAMSGIGGMCFAYSLLGGEIVNADE